MIIKENWFYDISDILDLEIVISKWITVWIYDSWINNKKIFLEENSFLDFFSFLENRDNHKIEFFQNENNSILNVKYLLFSKNDEIIKSKIYSKISSSYSKSDVKILSLIWNKGNIDLDWVIEIDSGFEKIIWHLKEENLFLSETWKMKWIPTLLVRSDDVEASHACKIEKISEKNLFYLKSRWIDEKYANILLLEANIKSIFSCLSMINNIFYESLINKIIYSIKEN